MYFEGLASMLDDLRPNGVQHRVLFLEADDDTLQTSYKATRRRHPLAPNGSVAEGIARERELLEPLRARADVVVDTAGLTAAMLRRKLAEQMLPSRTPGRLVVTFESFGFKYGPARDPDLMFDVRFLPNPHYERDLRPLTGRRPADRRVHQPGRGSLDAFYERLHPLLDYLLAAVPGRGQGPPGGRRSAAPAAATARSRSPSTWRALIAGTRSTWSTWSTATSAGRRDRPRRVRGHGPRALGRFYDAVLFALGARRMVQSEHAIAYGVNGPEVWIVVRGRAPAPATVTSRCRASGKAAVDAAYAAGLANGGSDDGAPGLRPQYGRRYYAAYLRDPDGLRVEVVSRSMTR